MDMIENRTFDEITASPKLRSTLEAAALCKMADRGQITGGVVDGPLAFDNAVSLEAARTKGITSCVLVLLLTRKKR